MKEKKQERASALKAGRRGKTEELLDSLFHPVVSGVVVIHLIVRKITGSAAKSGIIVAWVNVHILSVILVVILIIVVIVILIVILVVILIVVVVILIVIILTGRIWIS